VCGDDLLIFDSCGSKRFLNTPTGVKPRPTVVAVANEESRLLRHLLGPEPGGAVVLAASGKGGVVECVHSRAIWRFKSEVHGRPDRVTADESEIVSAGCLHIDQLWRLERGLVAERRESRFEETAAGIHVADVDLNVMEHQAFEPTPLVAACSQREHVSEETILRLD
jgi:hypothetical protein